RRLQHHRELARLLLDLDDIAVPQLVGGDGHPAAVDAEMAMADELTGGEHGRHELGTVDDDVEPALEQADQVLAGVALAPRRFLIDAAELALADVAVVALEPLLGHQLLAIVGRLLAPLAMLARAVIALVDRALRP